MSRDDLMKPDILSEFILAASGAAMVVLLVGTLWLSLFH
jgi:hypothetical protein